jgi:hypothetical protein
LYDHMASQVPPKRHKDNPNAPANFLIIFILTKSPSTNLIVIIIIIIIIII